MIPRFWRRLYAFAAVAYIALGFVFAGVAYAQMERIGPSFHTSPVTKVPTGSDDVTVQKPTTTTCSCGTCSSRWRPTG